MLHASTHSRASRSDSPTSRAAGTRTGSSSVDPLLQRAEHQFYVNGSPQASDVQFSDTRGTRAGRRPGAGRQQRVRARCHLPESPQKPHEARSPATVLWESRIPTWVGFQLALDRPDPEGWKVFVGNGYNSTNQKPVLYAINPQTGATMRKLDLCASLVTNVCNIERLERVVVGHRRRTQRPGFRERERRVRRRFAGQPVARRHQQCESRRSGR